MSPEVRRAALIATAVTLPLVLVFALVIAHITGETGGAPKSSSSSPSVLPAVTLAAPPLAAANATPCAKVLEQLPVSVDGLVPRVVHPHPDTPFVVAWGNPAVILRCGVERPSSLHAGSAAQFFPGGNPKAGPWYDITRSGDANVWTTVDRAVYISIEVPAKYAVAPVVALSTAIAAALPAVCSTDPTTPDVAKLCTRRS